MYRLILSLFLIIPAVASAQDVKKIKEKNGYYLETYYVLKSDKTVKHGPYEKSNKSGKKEVFETGFYNYGKKDSVWTFYTHNNKIREQGSYKNDERTGVWNFYNYDGTIEQTYDYTNDTILFSSEYYPSKPIIFTVLNGIDSSKDTIERPPLTIGGARKMAEFIARELMYPPLAVENGIQGTVYFSFVVDENGAINTLKFEKGVDGDLNAEAMRVMKAMVREMRWKPALKNGKPVKTKVTLPISFKLN